MRWCGLIRVPRPSFSSGGRSSLPVSRRGRRQSRRALGVLGLASALLAAVLVVPAGPAAAAPGDPFDPATATVFIAQNVPTQLFTAQTSGAGEVSLSPEGPASGVQYNAIAYNTADNYIYAQVLNGNATYPTNSLVRIGQGGVMTRVGTQTYDVALMGTFGPGGRYYRVTATGTPTVQAVDVTTGAVTSSVPLTGATLGGADVAFADGYLWVMSTGSIQRIDPATGLNTSFATGFGTTAGAAWTFANGNLGFSANATGDIFQVAVANAGSATPTFTLVATNPGPATNNNDGTASMGLPTDLEIVKDGPATYSPDGQAVSYTLTVTNNGPGNSTGFVVRDDVPATLTNVASASPGCSVSGGTVTCLGGALAAGASASYTVTATVPTGTTVALDNTATVTPNEEDLVPGNNTDTHTIVPAAPSYTVAKTASATVARPGGTITYTVTVRNTGSVSYTATNPATFTDDLSGVLDDATYNNDASNGATVSGATLSWSGPLAAGATETITYSVTVDSPDATGDGTLINAVTAPPGNGGGCDPASSCSTTTDVQSYIVVKEADAATVVPGETVRYTVTIRNTGRVAYTAADPASFTDDLSAVLDDATYNNDASNGATITGDTLSWSGPLAVGATETITYSVTVDDPDTGDKRLANTAVTPPGSGGGCPAGTDNPDCTVNIPGGSYQVAKVAGAAQAAPGDTVTYTVTVTNTGNTAYTANKPASFSDDLGDVLDDATYNGDATGGATVSDGTLTWSGPLAVGETVTITYSVTVKDSGRGDDRLANAVVPTSPGGGCATPQECASTTDVAAYTVTKKAAPGGTIAPGATVTYAITVRNTGRVPYTAAEPATFEDDLADVLDDATYNQDATRGATLQGAVLSWSGALAVGATVRVTYSVTVDDPDRGNHRLRNVVTSEGCDPADGRSPRCTTSDPVGDFDLQVVKEVVGSSTALPGDRVRYRLEVLNRGPGASTAPVRLHDRLPTGLRLIGAHGRGWECRVDRPGDAVDCTRARALAPRHHAAPVIVVAEPTRAAVGERVFNIATVRAPGERDVSDNRDTAGIRVRRIPPLPATGYRTVAPRARWIS